MQNEKLIHSIQELKHGNNQLKDENKYEETVSILIQRLGQTSGKLQILSKGNVKKMKIL